ncbi:MAG: homoserine kinase [Acidobacteria bacterium]|nr:MAG: homoserine kinase [Acidobacteriota bacterium]
MASKKWEKAFKSFQILVPGSISNLGCGFDTLGLAVSLYFKTSVHSCPAFHFEMKCNGKPLDLPEEENLFLKVLRSCYPVSPDDWHFHISIETEVPPKRGLGSSACAVVSAMMTAAKLQNLRMESGQLLHTSLQWEPHPDNLCASLVGGFTVAMQDNSGALFYRKLLFPRSLKILLLIPEWQISTAEARRLLPELYPQEAVVGNLQRLAYFIAALQDGNFRGLRESVRDQIHQPYRAALMPFARDLLNSEYFSSESAVMISGSGPCFAMFYRVYEKKIRSVIQEIMSVHKIPYELRNVVVDEEGTRIESLED